MLIFIFVKDGRIVMSFILRYLSFPWLFVSSRRLIRCHGLTVSRREGGRGFYILMICIHEGKHWDMLFPLWSPADILPNLQLKASLLLSTSLLISGSFLCYFWVVMLPGCNQLLKGWPRLCHSGHSMQTFPFGGFPSLWPTLCRGNKSPMYSDAADLGILLILQSLTQETGIRLHFLRDLPTSMYMSFPQPNLYEMDCLRVWEVLFFYHQVYSKIDSLYRVIFIASGVLAFDTQNQKNSTYLSFWLS